MKNGIMNSKVMEIFVNEMEGQLGKAFLIANEQDKEVELTIKMNIGILAKWKEQSGTDGVESMIQPEMGFKVTRKVKETKVASEGIISDAELKFDEDGNPYLVRAKDNQMDMDDYMEQQPPQDDIIDADYQEVKEEQKVIPFKAEELPEPPTNDSPIDVDYSDELEKDFFDDESEDEEDEDDE